MRWTSGARRGTPNVHQLSSLNHQLGQEPTENTEDMEVLNNKSEAVRVSAINSHDVRLVRPEDVFGGHSEPRCGNVPLTRTPNTTRGIRLGEYAPRNNSSPILCDGFLSPPPGRRSLQRRRLGAEALAKESQKIR